MELSLLFGLFIVLIFLGIHIPSAMLFSSIVSIVTFGIPPVISAERMLNSINSFPLLAVPFFILAGNIMNQGGLTKRLIDASRAFVGHYHGGTAQVNVVANIVLAGISGSAAADCAAIGSTLIPAMRKEGYDSGFAAGLTAAASTIGPVIPPSIGLIVYASLTELSVGRLFLAGIVPGLMMGLGLIVYVRLVAPRRGYPRSERLPWRRRAPVLFYALPALLAPIILVGGIVTGLYTATEGGVVTCVYGLVVGMLFYKDLRVVDLPHLLTEAVQLTAIPLFILACASVFGFLLSVYGFGDLLLGLVHMLNPNPTVFLIVLVGFLLLIGCFVEGLAAMVIFVPVLMPLISAMALDPIHVALIVHIAILVGTLTPPVGMMLFIAASIAGIPIYAVEVWPFALVITLVIMLMVLFPPLTTFLPTFIMG